MAYSWLNQAAKALRSHRRRRVWRKLVGALAAVVVFCTTYALILPAITMERQPACGFAEHTHTGECYDATGALACGKPQHAHTDACYPDAAFATVETAQAATAETALAATLETALAATPEAARAAPLADVDPLDLNGKTLAIVGAGNYAMTSATQPVNGVSGLALQQVDAPTEEDGTYQVKAEVTGWTFEYQQDSSSYHIYTWVNSEKKYLTLRETPYQGNDSDGRGSLTLSTEPQNIQVGKTGEQYLLYVQKEGTNVTSYVNANQDGNNVTGFWCFNQDGDNSKVTLCKIQSPDDQFKIKMEDGSTVTVQLRDVNGNSISAPEVKDIDAEAATRYIFGAKDAATADNDTVRENIAPQIAGYEFLRANNGDNNAVIYSIASKGYENTVGGKVDVWRAYGSEPLEDKNYYTITDAQCIVTLTYAKSLNLADHSGTVVNLFDYWLTDRTAADDQNPSDPLSAGINNDHSLKFLKYGDSVDGNNAASKWTKSVAPYTGIVNNTLGADGYPVLSGKEGAGIIAGESLAYLFDPNVENAYKASYRNVKGLMQIDANGYYYYDSEQNFAEFDEDANRFNLHQDVGVVFGNYKGQFFPFNKLSEVKYLGAEDARLNHYFGMTMATRFIQQNKGHTSAAENAPATTFEFSGDDDVWIFLDGVLVADLGGIHDAANVKIDFSTGDIVVNGDSQEHRTETTIKKCFDAAGKGSDPKDWRDNTFADSTTHTLNFFYLERGNTASNLRLVYNLAEIPATSIYKVNQYSDPIAGAGFAVYAAQPVETDAAAWQYRVDGTEDTYITLPADCSVNEGTGMITCTVGEKTYTITPRYVGRTDSKGEMIFCDEYNVPYSLKELQEKFGDYFVLREIKIPDGYRQVSNEVYLHIKRVGAGTSTSSGNSLLLLCENTYDSGVWAAPTLLATATNKLTLYEPYGDSDNVVFYDPAQMTDSHKGTLFAVVFKYQGPDLEEAKLTEGETAVQQKLASAQNWVPVYGDNLRGYSAVQVNLPEDQAEQAKALKAAALKAAKAQKGMGTKVEFAWSSSGTMQLEVENLPGAIGSYYSMLGANEKEKTKYAVAYYWTPETFQEATAENIYRVNADPAIGDRFTRVFGATIQVPNLKNRMYAQKLNEDGTRVDGATFALYQAEEETGEDGTSKIYYIAEDGTRIALFDAEDGEGPPQGTATIKESGATGTYSIDQTTGIIAVTVGEAAYTIKPAQNSDGNSLVATTSDKSTSGEGGTADFDNLLNGNYYMREIKSPNGNYQLNTTQIMVQVTDDAIYANAGTPGDGVRVGRGPGYVVSTLHEFASDGVIDKTLTWVYEKMYTRNLNSFDWVDLGENGDPDKDEGFKDTGQTTYLKYMASEGEKNGDVLFNYGLNEDFNRAVDLLYIKPRDGETLETLLALSDADKAARLADSGYYTDADGNLLNAKGTGTRRLYTDEGWSYLMIFQDSAYAGYAKAAGANYEILEGDIATLFSRSLFVQVTDEYRLTDITIEKKDSARGTALSGAEFVLYRTIGGEKQYYQRAGNKTSWVTDETAATKLATDSVGQTRACGLQPGTYYLKETKAPDGYRLLAGEVTFTIDEGKIAEALAPEGSGQEMAAIQGDALTLVVKNTPTYELPNTGGPGVWPYRQAGAALVLGAGALLGLRAHANRRRRRKGGAKG